MVHLATCPAQTDVSISENSLVVVALDDGWLMTIVRRRCSSGDDAQTLETDGAALI